MVWTYHYSRDISRTLKYLVLYILETGDKEKLETGSRIEKLGPDDELLYQVAKTH